MDVVDGFLFLVILLQIIAFLIGVVLLSVVYAVISRTKNRMVHLLLPALVMGAGFLFLMPNDAPMLLVGALIFVVPMAVLIPPFVFSNRFGRKSGSPAFSSVISWSRWLGCFFPISLSRPVSR